MSAGWCDGEDLGAAIGVAGGPSDETFIFEALYNVADGRTVESNNFHQTGLREARVKRSDQRIITTHVGSLSRPSELLTLNAARSSWTADVTAYDKGLAAAVTEVV